MNSYNIIPVQRLTKAQAVQCEALQACCGPRNGKVPKRGGRAWLAQDGNDVVVGFATVRRERRCVHIENCVVAPAARGNGLQRRLFNSIIAWALNEDGANVRVVRTYTDGTNWYSAANIVACGFQVYKLIPDPNTNGGVWVEWIRE